MQAAADSAAMAGALEFVSDNPSGLSLTDPSYLEIKSKAINQVYATLNYAGYKNGYTDSLRTVKVDTPIIDDTTKKYTITVSVKESRSLALLAAAERIFGKNYTSTIIGTHASARAIWQGDNCLLALKNSGVGFSANGTINLGSSITPQCGLAVNSNDPCAFDTRGSSVSINVPVYTVGGICMTGSPSVPPISHGYAIPDPYVASGARGAIGNYYTNSNVVSNSATCSGSGSRKDCTLPTPAPNTYYSINPMNSVGSQGTLTLSSGTYVFKGGISVGSQQSIIVAPNATVTLIIGGTAFDLSAGGTVNLNAPTIGIFSGITIACLTCTGTSKINGGPTYSGSIYAPNADITYVGNAQSPCVQIVASTINLSGTVSLNDSCIPSQNKSANYYARLTE